MANRFGRASGALAGALFLALTTVCAPAWAESPTRTVTVVYPASLSDIMQRQIEPAFRKATGIKLSGQPEHTARPADSNRDPAPTADVFISAGPRINLGLMGQANGDLLDWYALFAQSPLVVGYGPASKFAAALKSRPWYEVATQPGFRLGVTDPDKGPKGRLTAKALQRLVQDDKTHGLEEKLAANSQLVPAHALARRLQSHQLDAAFLYRTEALAAGIPSVPVRLGDLAVTYTIAILNHAPHPQAAATFVAFLLGTKGQRLLRQDDALRVIAHPVVFGQMLSVPDALQPVLGM